MGLYKGRYLIAIYDKDDNFIECATRPVDLSFNPRSFYRNICIGREGVWYHTYKYYLIDCLEKHDDIFAEEDEIFLKEEKLIKGKESTYRELAQRLGKSLRTIKRYAQKGLIKV